MKSLWNDNEAGKYINNPLELRVYTSMLLGQEPDLVLHGGGNTSVKIKETNLFGDTEELLYVKGSGWDLASIEAKGFAPVKMDVLLRMAELEQLGDSEMVRVQRSAMTNPDAPNPSVEAILHAIIPYKYVDHTHADAVVTITNTPNGEKSISQLYGKQILVIPYVMPGFILAKKIFDMTQNMDWSNCEGLILLNHGVFTFDDDARVCYEKMIDVVSKAEEYLKKECGEASVVSSSPKENLIELASIRRAVSKCKEVPMLAKLDNDANSTGFSNLPDVASIVTRGPLTPDHIIRTKKNPVIIKENAEDDIANFKKEYCAYFEKNTYGELSCLDPAPRWAVWPQHGTLSFGTSMKETKIVSDIKDHTIRAIQLAERLGGWKVLPEKELFDMEYWELEQAKLKKGVNAPVLQGKIALVTGAASGIGFACAEELCSQGAVVAALDINPDITGLFNKKEISGIVCDVTDEESIKKSVDETIRQYGGLDILISNAGIFPQSENIEDMNPDTWNKCLAINLTSHQLLLKACIPYLGLGIDPAVIIIASKNVPAPGPGVSAYSAAKAGLTQLARVAALELASKSIRVNVIHPNAVYDTGIWTDEVLNKRAEYYELSVEDYKTNNLLNVEVTSKDVAQLACSMAGPVFSKTTGAQVPIDGGNERVI